MNEIYDLVLDAVKVLFLIGVPLVIVAAFAGVLASVFQSFFSVQDATISYALRIVGVVIVFSALSVSIIGSLQDLFIRALAP